MRRIFPDPAELDEDALIAAYEYPVAARWVRASMVTSLDGATQGSDGRSRTLSSPGDKHVFAMLRALADVILSERRRPAERGTAGPSRRPPMPPDAPLSVSARRRPSPWSAGGSSSTRVDRCSPGLVSRRSC